MLYIEIQVGDFSGEVWLVYLLVLMDDTTSYNTCTPLLANLLGLLKAQYLCGHPYELLANCLPAFPLIA